jgi:hypothetical protein
VRFWEISLRSSQRHTVKVLGRLTRATLASGKLGDAAAVLI